MDKIFIIDAVNYLFRSYYAIGPMTNKQGISTSALYGFIRSVKKLIKDFSPKYVVCVFDGPDNRASRQKLYSEYKMHRKKAPDDLYPQFEIAFDYCSLAGIPALCVEGVEADDTMASIALFAKKKELETYLCTSDKDLMQMVDDKTFVLHAHKNNEIFDAKKVEEMFGIEPKQLLDYLAIVGDKSDNIPGIEGFGPKTATTLLKEFNTLDSIFDNLEKIASEKKREVLVQEKEKAYLSKKLATLNLNVDIPKDKDFYLLKEQKKEKLEDFYKEMNFLSLLKTVNDQKKSDENLNYQLINTEKELNNLIENLKNEKEIVVDTETSGLSYLLAELVGIGLCVKPATAFYIPLNGDIDRNIVISKLKELIENENISFVGHNLKFDYHILLNIGIEIKNISFDTLLASYLINPQNRQHSLDLLALENFNIIKTPIKELIGTGKKQISMSDVPLDKISNYCAEDVDYTLRLKQIFEKDIFEKNLEKVLYDIELPLLKVLAKMERKGIFVDKDMLFIMSEEIQKKLKLIEGEIFSEAGKEFNINSPKQLSEILYVDLAITPPKKKGSTFSTSADILEKLKGKSPIIDHILNFREYQKLLSTYVDAIPKQINPNTNRVHSSFSQSTTATGRLASKKPNLQNIPIRSEEGKKIREGFRPEKDGWIYLSSDYSQIELKFLAHFSEDPNLIKAFNNGDDIHSFTASLVYSVPIDEVTSKMRSNAKAVNFGIIYGQSAYGLSEQIGISPKEAKVFIDTYFERYPNILKYLETCKNEVHDKKIAYTIAGRQRPILEIDNKNPFIRASAERLAINTPLQGSAADLIKIAMIEIDKEITKRDLKGYMILQIHDELLFEIPFDEKEIFKSFVKDKMENVFDLKVPLSVDIEIGKNLAEC
ncbi:MAG: DNA polymerase I [Candidatus Anoxychlamydiales bacterium]|nr:DNA polymerase I [Candidatus Anoxychlamydiales bacterium]